MTLRSSITIVDVGPPTLTALRQAVRRAKVDDAFAEVMVVADDQDAARTVRHLLGEPGVVNVTVQTGGRLASNLAAPILRQHQGPTDEPLKPLTRLLESRAVRQVAAEWVESGALQLSSAGRRRLYQSLASAFRDMREREPDAGSTLAGGPATVDAAPFDIEQLYDRFLILLRRQGYYTRGELPNLAADAVESHWTEGDLPFIIYYLPRRFSAPELRLAQVLSATGRCHFVIGLTGDRDADTPVTELAAIFERDAVAAHVPLPQPLQQKADAGALSVLVAPDPAEEVRAVVRRIVADHDLIPFHRTAIIHRQDDPYAGLLREQLRFAGIPFSGLEQRTLADTLPGRLLTGLVALAAAVGSDSDTTVDRDQFLDWLTNAPVRHHPPATGEAGAAEPRAGPVPTAAWVRLAQQSRANGPIAQWQSRLNAHIEKQRQLVAEQSGEDPNSSRIEDEYPRLRQERVLAEGLLRFVASLVDRFRQLADPPGADPLETPWPAAAVILRRLYADYLWSEETSPRRSDGSAGPDHIRIDELLGDLGNLGVWQTEYNLPALLETVSEALQSPSADQGRPVGAGVYLGPPSGIVGTEYRAVYVVGMVERGFPPRPRVNPWLNEHGGWQRRATELERYDFLAGIAAADTAVLSWPAARDHRSAAHPSRWLIEAANLLHKSQGLAERLTYENLAYQVETKPWLTVIPSREAGLQMLAGSAATPRPAYLPADSCDYNLMHLTVEPPSPQSGHPVLLRAPRLALAVDAAKSRRDPILSPWDGRVGGDARRIARTGTRQRPLSASGLESWARCPFQYFLSRVLRIQQLPDAESDEISPLERGSLVHKILERFTARERQDLDTLMMLADEEFADAERRGITGYPLLWEIQKDNIRSGLSDFLESESEWFGDDAPVDSRAEVAFGPDFLPGGVRVNVPGSGEIWFRGKIDRIDVLPNQVRVRDFKSGSADRYLFRANRPPEYSVANGRALQLPIYLEATRKLHEDLPATASYCFPLDARNHHDVAAYTDTPEQRQDFHQALTAIIGSIRAGIFPATPDPSGVWRGNCYYCDFQRLCPARRRYLWENKLQHDPAVEPFVNLHSSAPTPSPDEADIQLGVDQPC